MTAQSLIAVCSSRNITVWVLALHCCESFSLPHKLIAIATKIKFLFISKKPNPNCRASLYNIGLTKICTQVQSYFCIANKIFIHVFESAKQNLFLHNSIVFFLARLLKKNENAKQRAHYYFAQLARALRWRTFGICLPFENQSLHQGHCEWWFLLFVQFRSLEGSVCIKTYLKI